MNFGNLGFEKEDADTTHKTKALVNEVNITGEWEETLARSKELDQLLKESPAGTK